MKRFFASLTMVVLAFPWPAGAAQLVFNPNLVISDTELTDIAVSDDFAQKFIESHGGGIASMKFPDLDGTLKTPGELITFYGRAFDVNPRYLLALIQKEQSLVSDPTPSVCQIDWAAGYGRPDGSTCNDPNWQKHRGFTSQIVNSAAFVQFFYEKDRLGEKRNFGYHPGVQATIDGTQVTPGNVATAMLYTYTPHLHGNQLLLRIWGEWFSGSHPDGTYLSGADGSVYVVQNGMKRKFSSKSAWRSRVDPSRVILVADDVLNSYPDGPVIKYADYSLVRVPGGGIYLLVRDVKRPVASMAVFRSIGFNPEEIDDVEAADVADYRDGTPITLKSSYPTGALLQDKKTGGVYFVEGGTKYPIFSAEIMKTNYPNLKLSAVSKTVLDELPTGEPVKFKDGELVSGPASNTVFVISNGMRRPIVSGEVFEKLGYAWNRVIPTNADAMQIHPIGPQLQ